MRHIPQCEASIGFLAAQTGHSMDGWANLRIVYIMALAGSKANSPELAVCGSALPSSAGANQTYSMQVNSKKPAFRGPVRRAEEPGRLARIWITLVQKPVQVVVQVVEIVVEMHDLIFEHDDRAIDD